MASRVIKVQESHSRNTHDWSLEHDKSGRAAFAANGRGLKYRIGMVFAFLAKSGGRLSAGELLRYLQGLHKSYTIADLSQVRAQLIKAGAITTRGRGRDALWCITPAGRNIIKGATFEWV